MNPGIYGFQDTTLLDPIGSMSKNLAGAVNPVRTPLHFPLSTNWNVNGNNIVLTYDTRLSFTRSAYGTVQTPSTTIYIPLALTAGTHRAIVDWGDGLFDVYQNQTVNSITHTYAAHGVYTIQITSTSIGGYGSSANLPDARPLRSVSSFGSMSNTSLGYAFFEAVNLNSVPSILPTGITSLGSCFWRASNINDPNISNWDVSNVTNMNQTFYQATNFNQSLDKWNTSKVTNMQNMFTTCTAFQGQGLENWNVSGVTVMSDMFSTCPNFNANLGSWDVRSLTTAPTMFNGCSSFIGSGLSNWQPRLAGIAQNMFLNCTRFGSGISLNLSNWNISGVTSFASMFNGCSSLTNLTISGWRGANGCVHTSQFQSANISGSYLPDWKITSGNTCVSMFSTCNLSSVSGLDTWNTSGITNAQSMFGFSTFNANTSNIGDWDTSNITNMQSMFQSSNFNQDIPKWNISKCTTFFNMFLNNTSFNGSTSGWNFASGSNCAGMFQSTTAFSGNGLEYWNVTGITNLNLSFSYLSNANATSVASKISGWNLCNCTDMGNIFFFCNISSGTYDNLLNSWAISITGNPIKNWSTTLSPHFGSSKYTAAGSGARQRLINYGWSITDGGLQT